MPKRHSFHLYLEAHHLLQARRHLDLLHTNHHHLELALRMLQVGAWEVEVQAHLYFRALTLSSAICSVEVMDPGHRTPDI